VDIALRNFSYFTKRMPALGEGLDVLVEEGYVPNKELLIDPWGRPIVLKKQASGETEIESLGGNAADVVVSVTNLSE